MRLGLVSLWRQWQTLGSQSPQCGTKVLSLMLLSKPRAHISESCGMLLAEAVGESLGHASENQNQPTQTPTQLEGLEEGGGGLEPAIGRGRSVTVKKGTDQLAKPGAGLSATGVLEGAENGLILSPKRWHVSYYSISVLITYQLNDLYAENGLVLPPGHHTPPRTDDTACGPGDSAETTVARRDAALLLGSVPWAIASRASCTGHVKCCQQRGHGSDRCLPRVARSWVAWGRQWCCRLGGGGCG